MTFEDVWDSLAHLGRHEDGGYRRYVWTEAEISCREWFKEQARRRDMAMEVDRNGNLWAWWGTPGPGAIVTGSHLDSVPDGGGYDGALGVASGFAAIDVLVANGYQPIHPIAVVAFLEEEGARFGVACLGSRLLSGSIDPERVRLLTDSDGITFAEAMEKSGLDPMSLGHDEVALSRMACFVELHVEQGRFLGDVDKPVGVASAIWAHGRWKIVLSGQGNHAGTTRLEDRADPMLPFAETVLVAREAARKAGGRATVGRVFVDPNGTNSIPSKVSFWLDARALDGETLKDMVDEMTERAREVAALNNVGIEISLESYIPPVEFSEELSNRVAKASGDAPLIPTQAGHDAGILAEFLPCSMIFVRNQTGVSHSPYEHSELKDCEEGVQALARVLEELGSS